MPFGIVNLIGKKKKFPPFKRSSTNNNNCGKCGKRQSTWHLRDGSTVGVARTGDDGKTETNSNNNNKYIETLRFTSKTTIIASLSCRAIQMCASSASSNYQYRTIHVQIKTLLDERQIRGKKTNASSGRKPEIFGIELEHNSISQHIPAIVWAHTEHTHTQDFHRTFSRFHFPTFFFYFPTNIIRECSIQKHEQS